MNRKTLIDCRSFFLDTGVIIDLLKVDLTGSDQQTKDRIGIVNRFFDSLNNPKVLGSAKKSFQLSSISIAEIFHLDGNNKDTMPAIVSLFNSQEVEIYSFDESAAIFHNENYYDLLSNTALRNLKKEVNYKSGSGFCSIKERIRKDMLIASTAKMYESDIILTTDKGFYDLCEKMDIFCYLFTDKADDLVLSGDGKLIYGFK